MTDRELLAAAMRYLYAHGWRRFPGTGRAWAAPGYTTAVEIEYAETGAGVRYAWLRWRRGADRCWSVVAVSDVPEAVDMLWAAGILPQELTGAYRAGYARGGVDITGVAVADLRAGRLL